jgi:hypothetical protein
LAKAWCGNKVPALILTTDEHEIEGPFETDTHHFIVVHLPSYLREATPDAAVSYLSRRTEVYETRMARLEEFAAQPEVLQDLLTAEQVAEWLTADPSRSDEVQERMPDDMQVPEVDPVRLMRVLTRYWETLRDNSELRNILFEDDRDGASAVFARWVADNPSEAVEALRAVRAGDLAALDAASGVARLQRFLGEWHENRDNGREEDWQAILTRESWVLGQLFGAPFVIVREKAYVGGKRFDNTEGRITDFLGQNRLTGNALVVEIKSPVTALLGRQYRQVYPPSRPLAGAITQALDQRHELIANYQQLGLDATGTVPFDPRAVVLIGDLDRQALDEDQLRSFELFRNQLGSVEVVTFDELAAKAEAVLEAFRGTSLPEEPLDA